ncbi:MAG: CehA/McbA family metallohydrolase [Gammaproteobacteria bacterium]|nr:CehA/McbA family metallohydrolase [Gammaproteobacteria bacterium]
MVSTTSLQPAFRLLVGLLFFSTWFATADVTAQAYPSARSGGNYMHAFYLPPAPSATPWAPAWAPDGQSVAVSMQGSIWEVEVETGVALQLTSGRGYHSSPNFSPDGRWLVYTADFDNKRIQLEVMNIETGEVFRLTDDDQIYLDPVFSPDGKQIAYVSTQPSGYFNIYIRNFFDGSWVAPPVGVTSDNDFGRSRLYFGAWDMHITPTWMPDGSELLLVSNRDVPLGSGNVLRVPAIENGIEFAETVLSEQSLYRTRPDVSIDGKRFVYSSTSGSADQYNNLYVQPTVGGEPYKMTFFESDAFHPRWSPDGEKIAFIGNSEGLSQLMMLETYGGKLTHVSINELRHREPMGMVSVKILDSDDNQLTPNRIHLKASDGKFYAPLDAYARAGHVGDLVFHNDGEFEVQVPVGDMEFSVLKGFEFHPMTESVSVIENEVIHLEVKLERLINMGKRGWHNASTHVHANYGGNLHNTLDNLKFMSRAEGQDLVLEQVANKDNRILDYHLFEAGGGAHSSSEVDQVVVVGQEYRPPFYGHVFMFGMKDHLISPFVTGYEGTAVESLYPSNTDMLLKAKAQGAVTGYVHPFLGEIDPLEGSLGGGKGFVVDAALGATDALEWSDASTSGFYPLYAVWNSGLRITATGGEDSISSLHRSKLIGSFRTYVYTGSAGLSMEAWFDGLLKGRALVTSGPILEMAVGSSLPGDTIEFSDDRGTLNISGRLRSIVDVGSVKLVCNGELIEEIFLGENKRELNFDTNFEVRESGWCHLRTEGDAETRGYLDVRYPQAFTNPIWFSVEEKAIQNEEAVEYALEWIEKLEDLAAQWPGWRSEEERSHVFAQFEEARDVYRSTIER